MPVAAGIGPFGVPELLIIAFIIILVFGVGRLPEVGGALGKGIREFRKSSKDDGEDAGAGSALSSSSISSGDAPAAGADSRFCNECGERNSASAKFCSSCGHTMGVLAS
jgi:sec-independent protein translocase protein TatA